MVKYIKILNVEGMEIFKESFTIGKVHRVEYKRYLYRDVVGILRNKKDRGKIKDDDGFEYPVVVEPKLLIVCSNFGYHMPERIEYETVTFWGYLLNRTFGFW